MKISYQTNLSKSFTHIRCMLLLQLIACKISLERKEHRSVVKCLPPSLWAIYLSARLLDGSSLHFHGLEPNFNFNSKKNIKMHHQEDQQARSLNHSDYFHIMLEVEDQDHFWPWSYWANILSKCHSLPIPTVPMLDYFFSTIWNIWISKRIEFRVLEII